MPTPKESALSTDSIGSCLKAQRQSQHPSLHAQSSNRANLSPTTSASLARELRDEDYRYMVFAEKGEATITTSTMNYDNYRGLWLSEPFSLPVPQRRNPRVKRRRFLLHQKTFRTVSK